MCSQGLKVPVVHVPVSKDVSSLIEQFVFINFKVLKRPPHHIHIANAAHNTTQSSNKFFQQWNMDTQSNTNAGLLMCTLTTIVNPSSQPICVCIPKILKILNPHGGFIGSKLLESFGCFIRLSKLDS
jgi:hypothetical protein